MSERDYGRSTLALIWEMYRMYKVERKEDHYYGAQIAAITLNSKRANTRDKVWTPEDLMPHHRKVKRVDNIDPDDGAVTDDGLKMALKKMSRGPALKRRVYRRPRV